MCKEKLVIGGSTTEEFKHGYLKKSNQLLLRKQIRDSSSNFSGLIFDFFQDLASFYYYNFQPSFLKGEGVPLIFSEGRKIPLRKKDYIKDYRETKRYPNVPSELGKEGTSLQEILMYIKEYEEEKHIKTNITLEDVKQAYLNMEKSYE